MVVALSKNDVRSSALRAESGLGSRDSPFLRPACATRVGAQPRNMPPESSSNSTNPSQSVSHSVSQSQQSRRTKASRYVSRAPGKRTRLLERMGKSRLHVFRRASRRTVPGLRRHRFRVPPHDFRQRVLRRHDSLQRRVELRPAEQLAPWPAPTSSTRAITRVQPFARAAPRAAPASRLRRRYPHWARRRLPQAESPRALRQRTCAHRSARRSARRPQRDTGTRRSPRVTSTRATEFFLRTRACVASGCCQGEEGWARAGARPRRCRTPRSRIATCPH